MASRLSSFSLSKPSASSPAHLRPGKHAENIHGGGIIHTCKMAKISGASRSRSNMVEAVLELAGCCDCVVFRCWLTGSHRPVTIVMLMMVVMMVVVAKGLL